MSRKNIIGWISIVVVTALIVTAEITLYGNSVAAEADTNAAGSDSLEYWVEGSPNAQSIIDFVAAVTGETSVKYVPPEKRIAVFDVDGTLLGELFPTYVGE